MISTTRELHRLALADADQHVTRIGAADLPRPTPCAGWTLADLLAHMIGQHRGFADAVRNGAAPATAYAPVPFSSSAWQESVGELTAAFAAAAEDSALVQVELAPVPIPLRRVVEAQLIDTVVHTWDIAQALGTDYTPGPVLAGAVVEIARGLPPTAYGPGAAFAPATALPGEPWGDTLALTGRIDRRRCPVPGFAV